MSTTTKEMNANVNEKIDDSAEKTKAMIEKARRNLKQGSDAVAEKAEAANEKLEDQYDKASNIIQEYYHEVKNYIQHNPIKAIGIAVVAGSAIAALINNKKS